MPCRRRSCPTCTPSRHKKRPTATPKRLQSWRSDSCDLLPVRLAAQQGLAGPTNVKSLYHGVDEVTSQFKSLTALDVRSVGPLRQCRSSIHKGLARLAGLIAGFSAQGQALRDAGLRNAIMPGELILIPKDP